mmetsp:Transcript_12825/g.39577  ORF Transcript_12825/g.39577 Transcript_12825/m.39577 type:complete len:234 (+) Transcript_12825:31-732(+)
MHRRYAAHVALLVCSTAAFQRAPLQASPVTRRPLSARTAEKPKPRQRPHGAGRARQGRKRGDLLRDIIDAPRAVEDVPKAKEDPLIPFVECLAKAADGRKATRTCAFHTAPLTDVASFVVAACGRSRPQNDAIAAAVVQDAREKFGREPKHVEGGADGGWTCIDFGDVIVNVMTPDAREFYDIDGIWARAEMVDLSDVVRPEDEIGALDDEDLFADDYADEAAFWDAPDDDTW